MFSRHLHSQRSICIFRRLQRECEWRVSADGEFHDRWKSADADRDAESELPRRDVDAHGANLRLYGLGNVHHEPGINGRPKSLGWPFLPLDIARHNQVCDGDDT